MESYHSSIYREHLTATVLENYPKYVQKNLIKGMEKQNVVKTKQRTSSENSLDLSEVPEEERLVAGIEKSQSVIRYLEKAEFIKSYKYAVIFNISNFDDTILDDLQEKGVLHDFHSENYTHDILFDEKTYKTVKPTKFILGNVIVLKFSRLLTGFTTGGTKKQIKYPILAIFFKHLGVLEIRFDQVRNYFQEDDYFYHKQVEFVLDWIKDNVECEIENINLTPIIESIRKKELDEVNVHAQAMSLKSGGKAVLETGINENSILPLLGELKELIKANEELFNKCIAVKHLLENFILETELTSDLPWISLIWKGENKAKGTIVKFKHNYMNQGYTLLQYYGIETTMERMNNVTEYIINNKGEVNGTEED